MGQKVNPIGLRLGINRTWDSRWYSGKNDYGKLLHEDMKIREDLFEALKQAAVSKIVIERPHKKCRVTIHSARPGVVIGKKGADIEKLRRKVAELTDSDVVINIVEIRKPELDAQLVAESIAQQLERRVACLRPVRAQGARAGADHGAADRSRAPRPDPAHEALGPRLDPRLPGRAGLEEAARGAHGLGQGHAGTVGGAGQAGPHSVR